MWIGKGQLGPYETTCRVPRCIVEEPWLAWDYAGTRICCRWVVWGGGLDSQLTQTSIIWYLHIPWEVLVHSPTTVARPAEGFAKAAVARTHTNSSWRV